MDCILIPKAYLEAAAVKETLLTQLSLSHQLSDSENDSQSPQSIPNVMYAACDDVRHRLARCLGYDSVSSIGMITFPSGSDAEYLPLIIALTRAYSQGTYVTNHTK
jgi:hypothetical protein